MHLYVITKGIKNDVDEFITQLQGKYLPFKWRTDKNQPFVDAQVQLSIRPIQLWEIGYPKEHHDIVCATVIGNGDGGVYGNDGIKPVKHKWLDKYIKMFRKILHLDPIPAWNPAVAMPVKKQNVSVIGLGTKQDYTMESGVEGL